MRRLIYRTADIRFARKQTQGKADFLYWKAPEDCAITDRPSAVFLSSLAISVAPRSKPWHSNRGDHPRFARERHRRLSCEMSDMGPKDLKLKDHRKVERCVGPNLCRH